MKRNVRLIPFGMFVAALLCILPSAALAATSFTNATAITITDCPNPCPASGQAASLYPSPITVSGQSGVVQRVSVTLNGLSHAFPADIDMLLVSPSGRKSVIMSDFGAGSPGVSNLTFTLDDYAARPVPSTVTGNTGVPFVAGNYRPANSGTTDLFPAPAPAAPYTYTLSAFNGENPNGTWSLYIIDDANLDGGSISGGWTLTFDTRPAPPGPGDILISEFRTRGEGTTPPGSDGSADEFIELYNNTDQSITIIDAVPGADPTGPNGAGWRIAGAQGASETTFLVIPQTLSTAGPLAIPPRGYFLISTQPASPSPAGNTYSLSTYPTGTGITASGSANISVNPASATVGFLPDDIGLAIFSTATATSARRLDSVGYSSVTNADYKEGAGLAPAAGITTSGQHSWVRRTVPTGSPRAGYPQDTGNNAADFVLVSTTGGMIDGIASVLGAPGPQRGPTMTAFTTTSAPMHTADSMTSSVVDPAQPDSAAPNLVRDSTAVTNGTSGTLKIRRKYTNSSGQALIAMRFRIVGLSTLTGGAAPAGQLDLRALNSPTQTITLTDTTTVTAQALTLQTPAAQPLGGGLNSSLAEGVITTTAPLANGASTVVEFNFGVNTAGSLPYAITIIAEGLPQSGVGGVSAMDTFSVVNEADLSITKTDGVTNAIPGGATTYTITASNAGPSAAPAATVADTFPAALTCTWTCVGAGGGTCTASGSGNISDTTNLPAGASVTYTASCTISAAATGTLSNTATVSSAVTDPTPANNSATDTDTLTPQADLAITNSDGVTSVTAGNNTTYTLVASNAGPSNAPGATVADTFPASCTSVAWTCSGASGGTCTASGNGNLSDTVNLPVGGSVTYTAICAVSAAASGTLSNTATVTVPAGVTDLTPGNNSQTDTTTILAPGALTITPAPLAFGNVPVGTTSAAQNVTLANTGGTSLQVTALTAAVAPFAQSGGTCGALPITIAAGSSCTIGYTFAAAAAGPASQNLTVTTNVGGGTIALSGTGTQGTLGVAPGSLSFGSVPVGTTSAAQSVTLSNTGAASLQVTAVTAAAAPFAQSGGTCGALPITIAAGASCTIGYTYAPTATGAASQTLTVTANVPGGGSVALSGTGTQGTLAISPTSINFGPVTVGSTSPVQFATLNNSGTAALQVTAVTPATTPFAQSGGTCGALPITIATGASCTIGYVFAPTSASPATANAPVASASGIAAPNAAAQTYTQTITMTTNAGSLNLTLTGQAQALIPAVPAPLGGWSSLALLVLIGLSALFVYRRS